MTPALQMSTDCTHTPSKQHTRHQGVSVKVQHPRDERTVKASPCANRRSYLSVRHALEDLGCHVTVPQHHHQRQALAHHSR